MLIKKNVCFLEIRVDKFGRFPGYLARLEDMNLKESGCRAVFIGLPIGYLRHWGLDQRSPWAGLSFRLDPAVLSPTSPPCHVGRLEVPGSRT